MDSTQSFTMNDLLQRQQADQCPAVRMGSLIRSGKHGLTSRPLSFDSTYKPLQRSIFGTKVPASFPMIVVMLSALLSSFLIQATNAQDCTNKTTTFLMLTNAKLEEPTPSDSVLTFNLTSCIQGCHQEPRCMAVNIESNPENAFCQYFHYTKSSRSEDAVPNEWPVQPMSIYYLQKTCLKGACNRAFSFELASGYDLIGHELILVKNSTEGHCMETCLASRQTFGIRCLSFTYSLGTQECRIHSESRFTRPGDFVKTNNTLTRYYDNHCEDELARQLDLDLLQAAALVGPNITREELLIHVPPPSFELVRKDTAMRFTDSDFPGVNLRECETLCTTNNEFICRSFVYGRTRLGLFCGLSHHTMASLRYVPNSVFPMYGVNIYQRRLPVGNDVSSEVVPLAGENIHAASSPAVVISAADALMGITTTTVLPPLQDVTATLSTAASPINITALKNVRRRPSTSTTTTVSPPTPRRQLVGATNPAAFGAGGSANNVTASLNGIELADAMLNALMDSAGLNNTVGTANSGGTNSVAASKNGNVPVTAASGSNGGTSAAIPLTSSTCWPNMILQSGKTVNIKPYRTLPQYTASECIAECERDQTCTAMQIDYSNAECAFFNFSTAGSDASVANASMRDSGMANYYEKTCFDRRNQAKCGGKDWAFELLRSKTLEMLDLQNGIFNVLETPTRDRCLEECIMSIGKVCKTVEYNMRTRMCRLSKLDRYSRTLNGVGLRRRSILRRESRQLQLVNTAATSSGTPAAQSGVDPTAQPDERYTMVYESNCFSEPRQFCTFDKIEGFDISLVDKTVMEGVKTEEDCRQLCLQETAFNCRTYSLISQFACMLSHHIMENAPPSAVVAGPKDAISHFQVKNCYNVTVECTPDAMRAVVETNRIFGGLLYARGRSATCTKHIEGAYGFSLDLPLPNQPAAQLCGTVIQQQQKDENATWYSNTVILQHNDHVVTSSDHAINVKCRYEQTKKTRLVHEGPLVRNTSQAISDTIVREDIFRWGEAQLPVPRMEVLDRMGKEMLEADLGDQMIVRISFTDPTTIYSVQATDLVARDSVGLNNMTLIDGDGCIVEGAIVKEVRKPRNDVFEIVLEVFAFPEDDTLVLEVIAETCHGLCPTAGTCLPDQTRRLATTRQGRYFPTRALPVKRTKRAADSSRNEAALARLRYALTAPVFRQARTLNSVGSGFVQYLAHENGNEIVKSALIPASKSAKSVTTTSPASIRIRRSSMDSPLARSDDDESSNTYEQEAERDGNRESKKSRSGSNTKLHEQQTTYHQKIIKVRNSRFDLPSDSNTVAAQQVVQPTQTAGCVSSRTFGAVLIGCALILLTAFGICMVLCLRYNTIRRALIKVGGGGAPSLYSTTSAGSRSLASSSLNSSSMTPSLALPKDSGSSFAASANAINSFSKLGQHSDTEVANNSMAALALRNQFLRQQNLHPTESDCYLTPEQARCFTQSHC